MTKLLIINGQSLYEQNATGITLRSMFGRWLSDDVMEICLIEPTERVGSSSCQVKSYTVPTASQPLNWLVRKVVASYLAPKLRKSILNDRISGDIANARRKEGIKDVIRGIIDVSPIRLKENLLKQVDDFSPDVIYTMGASITTMKLALYLSKRYHCNIVLHCMDNWRDTLYTSNILLKPIRMMLLFYLRKVEKQMHTGLAISEKMAQEYSARSGCKYKALMNCVKEEDIKEVVVNNGNRFAFVYAGGLHLDRWKSLLEVEKGIGHLQIRGPKIQLYVFTNDRDKMNYEKLFNSNITVFKEFLSHDHIMDAYADADVLVHIESFDVELVKYTKYSLSTKIPEYMSAGKPIVCFAPRELAVSEYINLTGAGIAVSTQTEFVEVADLLIQHPGLRRQFAEKGIEMVLQKHTEKALDNILINVLK